MSSYGPVHPLDVELADLVDGVVDEDRVATLEAHLADCLLCRIKCRRLRAAPPVAPTIDATFPAIPFALARSDDRRDPAPGELWLVGQDMRTLVLVRGVDAEGVAVAPVTFDVEAADDETVIVGADQSPLQIPLAVYPRLTTEVPRTALHGRVGVFAASQPDLAGGTRGEPIAGASDPRLEIRQHLADVLGTIDAPEPDPATAADAPALRPEHVRSALIADLRALRGETCTVRPLHDWQDVWPAQAHGWTPLASVDEVGVVLVVLDTPHGLADDHDFDAARSVLTRFNASALVVLAREVSDRADVFDSSSLNYGIDTPSGQHSAPRPLVGGLVPFDAIAKYLDQVTGARAASAPSRGSVAHVDVADLLRESTAAAIADAVRQGARFKIAPKRRGYESLADAEESLDAALAHAFAAESVVEKLLDLARRSDKSE